LFTVEPPSNRNWMVNANEKKNTVCFKKSFTNLKAYINLFRGYAQCFELSQCSKTHRVLAGIVTVQCDFHLSITGITVPLPGFTVISQ
jgi:hypothetical protein